MKKVLTEIITKTKFGFTCMKNAAAMPMSSGAKKETVEHQNFRQE